MRTRSLPLTLALILPVACGDSSAGDSDSRGSDAETGLTSITSSDTSNDEAGDSDSTTNPSQGDGDGDTAGDGDGDTAGDGDGDTAGDGDGDTAGDGDGDTTGDPSECGNGIVEAGEECDDGNQVDDDECDNSCKLPPSPCGTQEYEAMLEVLPVDIIISIDNSGSMGQEIIGVQDNINVNFAQIIQDAGLDYRVIMVTEHGPAEGPESVCIEAPLSGIAQGGCANPPPQPINNPPIFFHYSVPIASHDMWCKLLDNYPVNAQDQFGQAGWSQWLRPEAFKTFIAISDDGVACGPYDDNDNANDGMATAFDFNEALLNLAPEQFGTFEDPNYSYNSIVGLGENDPPDQPYTPDDPIITSDCSSAAANGTGHQGASIISGGLRFPLCDTSSYDVVFQAIAQQVIEGSPVACELPVPDGPNMQPVNQDSVTIEYTPGGGGDPITFTQVAGPNECGPLTFYIENDTIYLCPDTCDLVQGDVDAAINIEFQCFEPG